MGIFKKAIAKRKEHKANHPHRNAGDRHHSRVAGRHDRRALKRHDKHAMKLEKIALRGANHKTTFGALSSKGGAVLNQYLGRKNKDTGEVEDGFMNEDGTMTSAKTGEVITPNANDEMYISQHAAESHIAAGGSTDSHDDFNDSSTERIRKPLTVTVSAEPTTTGSYNWSKVDGETSMSHCKRLFKDKPLVMWTSTIGIVGLLIYVAIAGIKAWKNRKKSGSTWKK